MQQIFIHCADIHLGSPLSARLSPAKAAERRREMCATFGRMADYAEECGARAVLISGDLFDADITLKKDKDYFYSVVESHPALDFIYLRGNHDGKQSYDRPLENLKTFGESWSCFNYGNVTVAGLELNERNVMAAYSTLRLDPSRINIVMLHGPLTSGGDGVNLTALRAKNIDYLALGHIHSFQSGRVDERGIYAYSGCLEPRGFDEPGPKGFVQLAVGSSVDARFVPFALRTVAQAECDVSGCENAYAAVRAAMTVAPRSPEDMLRLTLSGDVDFDSSSLAADVQKELEPYFHAVHVRSNVRTKTDVEYLASEPSLRGAFVRAVTADDKYPQDIKQLILSAGLKALAGRGNEL